KRKNTYRSAWKAITHWTSPLANLIPIIKSQSSLSQLTKGNIEIAVVSICPIEKPVAKLLLKSQLVPLFTPVKKWLLKSILHAKNEDFSAFSLLKEEINYLHETCTDTHAKVIQRASDIEPGKLNLIISIEGGHSLVNGNTSHDILENLKALKQGPDRVLYFTLTHLAQNALANHAYAMKKVLGKHPAEEAFFPSSTGLSRLGTQVISRMYEEKDGQRIMVDIKHLSLKSRLELYKLRQENNWQDIPLIASHCAVTGFPHAQLPDRILMEGSYVKGRRLALRYRLHPTEEGLTFNPWSINLYDEEITEIINSGGLIGLSLDERILGNNRRRVVTEEEWFYLPEMKKLFPSIEEKITSESQFSLPLANRKRPPHLWFLAHNILHIVKVGGPQAWEHMCLGSDFDGLINPIRGIRHTGKYSKLENSTDSKRRRRGKDLVYALEHLSRREPDLGWPIQNLEQKVRGIMYNNALRFIQQHL
ncbi:MAG: membrane dipeptidase, partial [Bacteroidota bacterium]